MSDSALALVRELIADLDALAEKINAPSGPREERKERKQEHGKAYARAADPLLLHAMRQYNEEYAKLLTDLRDRFENDKQAAAVDDLYSRETRHPVRYVAREADPVMRAVLLHLRAKRLLQGHSE